MKVIEMVYTKKCFLQDKWPVLIPKMTHILITLNQLNWILDSQGMISFMIATGSLNYQDMTRILKQWRHDFSGKHLRDRYCMDIIWCLCGGQNSWFFCKASLRICYVSFFECKGPGMLNTYKLPCVEQKITKTRLKKYHIQWC